MNKPIKVIISDDHAQVRAGLCALLSLQENIQVIGEARDGVQTLRLAKQLKPDVILMDVSMPKMDGVKTAEKLAKDFPDIRVILMSMHSDRKQVHNAYQTGVKGFLLKSLARELLPAVQQVFEGKNYYSAGVSPYLSEIHGPKKSSSDGFCHELTPRQRQVLQLIAEGYTTREIADKLEISVKTAETHRTQMMGRLDIHEVAGLVRYAIRNGLATADA
jgi:DNA-binding NarL/FixJ family response regulator